MSNFVKWALPATILAGIPQVAWGQAGDDLMQMEGASLRGALQTRYDAALTATQDPALISANDPRYIWASEAKAQCAIAIGYIKGGVRDAVSIGKCEMAYRRMLNNVPVVIAPQVPTASVCQQPGPAIVFFDFDSDVPPATAGQSVDFLAQNAGGCNWSNYTVVGHTDRAGSDAYNDALSVRRAEAVAALLASRGLGGAQMSVSGRGETNPRVPTADGERNPQNRRVEVTVN